MKILMKSVSAVCVLLVLVWFLACFNVAYPFDAQGVELTEFDVQTVGLDGDTLDFSAATVIGAQRWRGIKGGDNSCETIFLGTNYLSTQGGDSVTLYRVENRLLYLDILPGVSDRPCDSVKFSAAGVYCKELPIEITGVYDVTEHPSVVIAGVGDTLRNVTGKGVTAKYTAIFDGETEVPDSVVTYQKYVGRYYLSDVNLPCAVVVRDCVFDAKSSLIESKTRCFADTQASAIDDISSDSDSEDTEKSPYRFDVEFLSARISVTTRGYLSEYIVSVMGCNGVLYYTKVFNGDAEITISTEGMSPGEYVVGLVTSDGSKSAKEYVRVL